MAEGSGERPQEAQHLSETSGGKPVASSGGTRAFSEHLSLVNFVKPGKEQALKEAIEQIKGPRRSQAEEFMRGEQGLEITRLSGWLQQTPEGQMLILHYEGRNPLPEVATRIYSSESEFGEWLKGVANDTLGIDFDTPTMGQTQPVELLDWQTQS